MSDIWVDTQSWGREKAEGASNENRVITVLCCLEILELDTASHNPSLHLHLVSSSVCVSIIDIFCEKKYDKKKNPDFNSLQLTGFKKYVKQISDRYENTTDLALLGWLEYHNLALLHCISVL